MGSSSEFSTEAIPLSVLVPVRNEAENIRPLVTEIVAVLKPFEAFEILYIDDGSTDDTADALEAARAEHSMLRVIRHSRNAGQSRALWNGALHARGEWLATLDGDGQNDPADIPLLWEARNGKIAGRTIELVAGVRRGRQDSWIKRISSRVANSIRRTLLGDRARDTGCGLKVIRRKAFLALPYFDHMHRFVPALIERNGGGFVEVLVNHRPRLRGRSNYGTLDRLAVGIIDLFGVLWLKRRITLTTVEPEK